jgi:predicted ATPase/DNA-binding CsgD family transcriptional regulator
MAMPGLTPFLGRTADLRHVTGLIEDPSIRLVTLLGPGGIGKTRLSLRIAESVGDTFPGGWYVIPLASATDAGEILPRIADALKLGDGPERPLLDRIATVLEDQRALVIVDNLEQIEGAGRPISDLLRIAPTVTVVATSRSPLHVEGEHEYPLAPFSLPPKATAVDPDSLMVTEAGAFFVQAIQRVRPGFTVTAANAGALADICRRLDGLPLALELAAARIKMFTPGELRDRLHRRLPILTSGHSEREARQQTMRQAIAWSYDLLAPDLQRQFRRLALFRGGFTLDAAESYLAAVAQAAGDAPPDALECVSSLLDHSLIMRIDADDAETRYQMLETIREFGLEHLAARGEEATCQDRFAVYWLARAEATWAEAARMDDLVRALAALERDHANLSAAIQWTSEHQPAIALELAGALFWFWYVRGHHGEADRFFRHFLGGPVVDASPGVRARALMAAGAFAHFQASTTRAMEYLHAALALWRTIGEAWGTGFTLFVLGVIAEDSGDYRHARALLEEAVSLLGSVDDHGTMGSARYHLAVVAFGLGEYERAQEMLAQVLPVSNEAPVLRVTSWALHLQGLLCFATGDLAGALNHLQASLRGFHAFRTPQGLAEGLAGLAVLASATGQPLAARLWGAAEHLMFERGDTFQLPERDLYDRSVSRLREEMPANEFERHLAIGRAWSLDEAVAAGLAVTPGDVAAGDESVGGTPLAVLSEREREVLLLVVDGWTNDRIAAHLFLSPRTVQTHLSSIYRKLQVSNRTEAASLVMRSRASR